MKGLFLYLTFLLVISNFCYADVDVDDPENFNPDLEIDSADGDHRELRCPIYPRPIDCEEVFKNGNRRSGIYTIWPRNRLTNCRSMEAFCDMDLDGGGWTVIQRRGNFGNGQNYFTKQWQAYKDGFGNLNKEFWYGNDNIYALTNQVACTVRFDMRKVDGNSAFAVYDHFWIEDELEKYRLHIKGYSGTAGDGLGLHDMKLFYTQDQKNLPPGRNAHDKQNEAGWWYNVFPSTCLNGINYQGYDTRDIKDGIVWDPFTGYRESLGATEIKIRSKNFRGH